MARAVRDGKVRPLAGSLTSYLLFDFDSGRARLQPLHEYFLREAILSLLKDNEGHSVRLVGRAGPYSRQRVTAAARLLTKAGVERGRIEKKFAAESAREKRGAGALEVHIDIARVLTLLLDDGFLVRPAPVFVQTIWMALAPVARMAGRELKIELPLVDRRGELTLHIRRGGEEIRRCDGTGRIDVGAHQDLSIGAERVFENGETDFARFAGNTALHELGHRIARLEHTSDPRNVMYFAAGYGSNLPPGKYTRADMRRHWSGHRTFNPDQARRLAQAMQTAHYTGGL